MLSIASGRRPINCFAVNHKKKYMLTTAFTPTTTMMMLPVKLIMIIFESARRFGNGMATEMLQKLQSQTTIKTQVQNTTCC